MGKSEPVQTPKPGAGAAPGESTPKPTLPPPGDRPDPFIRGLDDEPETD